MLFCFSDTIILGLNLFPLLVILGLDRRILFLSVTLGLDPRVQVH